METIVLFEGTFGHRNLWSILLMLAMLSCSAKKQTTDVVEADAVIFDAISDVEMDEVDGPTTESDVEDEVRPERDSGSDSDVRREPETGRPVPLPSWLEGVENTCAPTELRVPHETLKVLALPEPLGEVPREVWRIESPCVPNGIFHSTAFGLGSLTVNGEKREVIVAAVDAPTPFALAVELRAIAFIDALSGELLDCHHFEQGYFLAVAEQLMVSSELDRYWLFASSETYEVIAQNDPIQILHSGGIDEVLYSHVMNKPDQGFSPRLLLGNGQWIFVFESEYLISVDALTGEFLWVREIGELWENNSPSRRIHRVFVYDDHRFLVSFRDSSGRYDVKLVDECGNPTHFISGEGSLYDIQMLDSHLILSLDGVGTVVYRDGIRIHTEHDCHHALLYKNGYYSCLIGSGGREGEVRFFNLDGSERSVFELPSLTDHYTGTYFPVELATRDERVLVRRSGRETNESPSRTHTYLFVDSQSGDITTKVTVPPPGPHFAAPLFSSSGLLLVPSGPTFVAFQTDTGLAPSALPRGSVRGGNENRGSVVLPP
ncbi:MAG: hypothetical protein ACNA8W_06040 [Bradymonadaceae bacterium]